MAEALTPKPVVLAVDDDAQALARIERELCDRYDKGYRVVCNASAEEGIVELERCKADGEDVALVLADRWMAETSGSEFLERARLIFTTAKRVLLIAWRAWGDRRSAEAILRAMTLGGIDSYLIKP
jgi:thioredoxin reductase (NADPH)